MFGCRNRCWCGACDGCGFNACGKPGGVVNVCGRSPSVDGSLCVTYQMTLAMCLPWLIWCRHCLWYVQRWRFRCHTHASWTWLVSTSLQHVHWVFGNGRVHHTLPPYRRAYRQAFGSYYALCGCFYIRLRCVVAHPFLRPPGRALPYRWSLPPILLATPI